MRSPLLQLLLLHVSSLYIYGNVVTAAGVQDNPPIYMCTAELTTGQGENAVRVDHYISAQLTKGCVVRDKDIIFDLEEMYKERNKLNGEKKDPVVINISEADFINSHIKQINAYLIKNIENAQPLLFTISDSKMSDTGLDFGSENGNRDNIFKLPPHSRISILRNKISITTKESIFIFNALQLYTDSSMEIAHNVITMEHKSGRTRRVFYTGSVGFTIISDKSSFTLHDNEINMNGCCGHVTQYVWYQDMSSLIVTKDSSYTWASNNISMVVSGGAPQSVHQYVWYALTSAKEAVSNSQILIYSNSILMLAEKYTRIWSAVLKIESSNKAEISGGSSVVWKGNCVGMGHKETDKRYVFIGKWSITDDNSELLLDGNNFTTTNEYDPKYNRWQAKFLWGNSKEESPMTIERGGKLTVANTNIHGNSLTGSMVVWSNQLYTKNRDVKHPDIEWSSSPAKDSRGSPIPKVDNSNIRQYMCDIPNIPTPTHTATHTVTVPPTTILPPKPTNTNTEGKPNTDELPTIPKVVSKPTAPTNTPTTTDNNGKTKGKPHTKDSGTDKPPAKGSTETATTNTPKVTKPPVKSATAMSSTIPAVVITSVVFLYLCNW